MTAGLVDGSRLRSRVESTGAAAPDGDAGLLDFPAKSRGESFRRERDRREWPGGDAFSFDMPAIAQCQGDRTAGVDASPWAIDVADTDTHATRVVLEAIQCKRQAALGVGAERVGFGDACRMDDEVDWNVHIAALSFAGKKWCSCCRPCRPRGGIACGKRGGDGVVERRIRTAT